MKLRLVGIGMLVAVLLGLVVYSQWSPEPVFVSGFIEADEIRLGSQLGGRVARVHVREGERVTAGDLLLELEPFDLLEQERELEQGLAVREAEYQRTVAGYREEEKQQAKAKLLQLESRRDLLRAGPRPEEIEAARGRLAVAEAEKTFADRAFQRVSRLASENASSKREQDRAREMLDAATASWLVRDQELRLLLAGTREEELREASARVAEAQAAWQLLEHGYRTTDVEQAKAARNAAQATLAALRQRKLELSIRSPIDGIVEALDLQVGEIVAPRAPIVSLVDPAHLWVRAYVPQKWAKGPLGQAVIVTVDGFPDEEFRGIITYVARQAEFTPSNVQTPEERSKQVYRIKVDLSDDRDRLRPGMTADVWFDLNGAHHAR